MDEQKQRAHPAITSVAAGGSSRGASVVDGIPTILIAIASYGNGNDAYLQRLLTEFRSMRLRVDLHVLSNIHKELGPDVTVHVGLPTRNPRSLPFAHRRLFAERIATADYFIYCEDDTLVTERNIRAFLEVNCQLNSNEIPGFLRVERLSTCESYLECAHGAFRWDPSSLVRRGSSVFASFTNFHSAFTMASRAQVQQAIDSGGFLVAPHVGRFAMLESAASDIYTQCGLTRLVCVSRIEDFLVPHLSNQNCLKWGIPYAEFVQQTHALQQISTENRWNGSLFEVETRMPRGLWSKNLYERPDRSVLNLIPHDAETVLCVGSGWGATEEFLAERGKQVAGIPVDGVFADCLRRRRIEVIEGPIDRALQKLRSREFDVVLMQDFLQLLHDPVAWLSRLKALLSRKGVFVASVPRTFDPLRMVWYIRGEPAAVFPKKFADTGVQRVTRRRLQQWFKATGMHANIQLTFNTPKRIRIRQTIRKLSDWLVTDRFIVLAWQDRAASNVNPGRSHGEYSMREQ